MKPLGLSQTDGMSNTFATRERTKIICVPDCARTIFFAFQNRARALASAKKKIASAKKNADARARAKKSPTDAEGFKVVID